jgi:hypothetical protein
MKVMYVEEDIAKTGLVLSAEQRGFLTSSHISLVFHIAASLSFQETLLETMQQRPGQQLTWCVCVKQSRT